MIHTNTVSINLKWFSHVNTSIITHSGRVAVALVAGVHAGNRGLSAAAGINAALAQVAVAHIEMPRAAAYGRLDAAAEAQVALYRGNQGRRVANVRVGKGRSGGGRV
jgi:hypothetical protein